MPYQQFVSGTSLTAEQLQAMEDETVHIFDNASQRDSQLPSPAEGMHCYLKTTNRSYHHDGTSWVAQATKAEMDAVKPKGGTATGNTNATGYFTVTHGCPFTPAAVVASLSSSVANRTVVVTAITATTFEVRYLSTDGTSTANVAIGIRWIAVA